MWLIVTNRVVNRGPGKIWKAFEKKNKSEKRKGYFDHDGYFSAWQLKPEEEPMVDHSKAYNKKKHTLGEIVHGGAGSSSRMIVMFILFQKKYFVLMNRKQMVLVRGRVYLTPQITCSLLGKPGHGGLPQLPRDARLLHPVVGREARRV